MRSNRLASAVIGVPVALAICNQACYAEPQVSETINYYDVSGADASEVKASLDRNGPVSPAEGRRHHAYTHWYISWRYQYRQPTGRCAIASVSTDVKVTIDFPRLKTDATTPEALTISFARYVEKLMLHERGHVQNAITFARKIESGIRALGTESNCETLQDVANALGRALIEEAKQADIDYDSATRHGASQGATFP